MAEPARQLDDDSDRRLAGRPHLRALEGGGGASQKTPSEGEKSEQQSSSGKDLSAAEATGNPSRLRTPGTPEGSLYKKIASPTEDLGVGMRAFNKILGNRRKKGFWGILFIIVGIMIYGTSLLQGPFQFIHFAQLLNQFHWASGQDTQDDRVVKIARYIHDPLRPENLRLGVLANKYASALETDLNKSGIQSAYSDRFGLFDGYVIDPQKMAGSELDDLKDKSPAEIKKYFKDNFNVELTERPCSACEGKLFLSSEGLGYFQQRGIMKFMMRAAGYSRISAAITVRIMGKRAGINWHPLSKLKSASQRKLEKAQRFKAWEKEYITEVQKGADSQHLGTKAGENCADNDQACKDRNKAAQEAANAADETQAQAQEEGDAAKAGDPDKTGVPKTEADIRAKLGGSAAGVVALACLARGLYENVDAIHQNQVILPLIRMGMRVMATGGQAMNGTDADAEQMGFFATLFNDPVSKLDWTQARSIQAEEGKPLTGPDIRPEAKVSTAHNFITDFLSGIGGIPILGPICSVLGGTFGFVLNFVGGGFQIAANLIIQYLLAPQLIPALAHWLAGEPINPLLKGADFGNFVNYGSRLAANDAMASVGGAALSTVQAADLKNYETADSNAEFKSQSLAHRLFDRSDYRSVAGHLIDDQNGSLTNNVPARVAGMLTGLGRTIASLPNLIFRHAGAVTTANYNYGFPKVGFSADVLNNKTYGNPYRNAAAAIEILNGPNGATFIENAKKCFGVSIDPTDGNVISAQSGVPKYKDIQSAACTSQDPDWLRVRFLILDTTTMESMACYQGDDASCTNLGFASGSYSSSNPDTTTVPAGSCDPRTTDLGMQTGYQDKKPIQIHVCGLPNLPSTSEESKPGSPYYVEGANGKAIVNASVSKSFFDLVEAAHQANRLAGGATSSFRTMAHQQYLCQTDDSGLCQKGDYTYVGEPGTSNHQMGLAIDFVISDPTKGTLGNGHQNCIKVGERCTAKGYADWEWLDSNAGSYDIKPYINEFWHWSPSGN